LSVPVTDAMKESKNYEIPGLEFVVNVYTVNRGFKYTGIV